MTRCLICGRSSAEQRIAHLTTKGGLRLLLCEVCSERWRGYGVEVTTSLRDVIAALPADNTDEIDYRDRVLAAIDATTAAVSAE